MENVETTPQNSREHNPAIEEPSGADISASLVDLGASTPNEGPRDNSLFDNSLPSLPGGDTRQAFNQAFMEEPAFPEEDRLVRPSENTRTVEAQLAMLGGGFADEVENEGDDFNNEVGFQPRATTALEDTDFKPEGLGVGPLDDSEQDAQQFELPSQPAARKSAISTPKT